MIFLSDFCVYFFIHLFLHNLCKNIYSMQNTARQPSPKTIPTIGLILTDCLRYLPNIWSASGQCLIMIFFIILHYSPFVFYPSLTDYMVVLYFNPLKLILYLVKGKIAMTLLNFAIPPSTQRTQDSEPLLVESWPTVYAAGLKLSQRLLFVDD